MVAEIGTLGSVRAALRSWSKVPLAVHLDDGQADVVTRVVRGELVGDEELGRALVRGDPIAPGMQSAVARNLSTPMIIPAGRGGKATALLSVRGVALYDLEFQPYAFSTLLLSQNIMALANDPEVGLIVLDIDTPGGLVTGTPEAADAVAKAAKIKTIAALVNPLAASAGYHIVSQASEITSVPSGRTGSVGVFMMHISVARAFENMGVDVTFLHAGEHKTEGNMFEPLSNASKTYFQGEVDKSYRDFVRAVSRGRRITVARVERDFGQGRVFKAPDALTVGMIDRVATVTNALSRWSISAAALEGRRRGLRSISPKAASEEQSRNRRRRQRRLALERLR